MSSQTRSTRSTRSTRCQDNCGQPHLIFTNDDLLTEILIRLPILCIHLFTSVSKQWLQILTSPNFTLRRSKNPNLDPLAGFFANRIGSKFECDFVSFDSRLESKKFTMDLSFDDADRVDHVWILQSCNGLLLCTCSSWHSLYYYVYNTSINLFKRIPLRYFTSNGSSFCIGGVFRMAFNPRKSRYYKVVQACRSYADTIFHIYSSETGNWIMCRGKFKYVDFVHFHSAVYWNDAFHWLEGVNMQNMHRKLNIKDHEHPIMSTLRIPHSFCEGKLFESCGCLLLVCRNLIEPTALTIYEMIEGSSVWSVKYHISTNELPMNTLPEGWSIRASGWSYGLGEGEEDAFLMMNLPGKLLKYNLISKIINEIYNQVDDNDDIHFFPPFSVDPNLYEFIPSLASVCDANRVINEPKPKTQVNRKRTTNSTSKFK